VDVALLRRRLGRLGGGMPRHIGGDHLFIFDFFFVQCFIYAYVFALLSWLSIIVEAGMVV
jgi:hypothetical protein